MPENSKNDIETAKADLRRGMIEFVVLVIIEKGKVYASDILKELKAADLLVVEGTLYPLLNRLKNEGILEYIWEESKSGPPRKYYSLTNKGKNDLTQLKVTWKSLTESVESLMK